MKTYYIYGLKSPENLNEYRYIGFTCNKPHIRYKQHIKRSLNNIDNKYIDNTHKSNWIRKILKNNSEPIIEIINEYLCEEEFIKEQEIYYIKYYKNIGHRLTNILPGGNGGFGSGENSPWYGKKLTKEHISKISKSQLGEKSANYGKIHKNETIELIIKSKDKYRKTIIQYDLNNNLMAEYESVMVASKMTGMNSGGISSCANNKRKRYKGFIWKFKNDDVCKNETVHKSRKNLKVIN